MRAVKYGFAVPGESFELYQEVAESRAETERVRAAERFRIPFIIEV